MADRTNAVEAVEQLSNRLRQTRIARFVSIATVFTFLAGNHLHIVSDVPLIIFMINDLIICIVHWYGDNELRRELGIKSASDKDA